MSPWAGLCFCSLGREQELGEVSVVEVVGGAGRAVFSSTLYAISSWAQLPLATGSSYPAESPQCQAGRLTQQSGWHMPVVRLPALLRWLSVSLHPSPFPGLSASSGGGGPVHRVGQSPAGLMFRATGHRNSLSFLPRNLLSYLASVV